MAIYENKFEVGDKITITNRYRCYDMWKDMAKIFDIVGYDTSLPQEMTTFIVISYGLIPDRETFIYCVEDCLDRKQYLMQEEGLAHIQQGEKEMEQASTRTVTEYKQRSEWVKNTGEKPDLPDGTLVKARWCDGDETVGIYNDIAWYISESPQVNILKWRVVDDWNEVTDGKAPDIAPSTPIEVKNMKEYGGNKYKGKVDDFVWDMIKKWRFAKKD